jgi:hypothetical protein
MEWNIQVDSRIWSHLVEWKHDFLNNATFSDVTHALTYSAFIKVHKISCQKIAASILVFKLWVLKPF